MHNFKFSIPLLVIFLAGFIAGCSSAPDQPESELTRKNRAAEYTQFGNTHFNAAHYQMAAHYFELALQENIAVDNLPGIAKSYNSIGRVLTAMEQYNEAEIRYQRAMKFSLLADDVDQIVQSRINLGDLSLRRGDVDRALQEFQDALNTVNNERLPSYTVLHHNIGTVYARLGEFDSAHSHIETARAINEEERRWSEVAGNYYMLASIASRQNDFSAAKSLALTALEYDKRAENSPGIAADLAAIGAISQKSGEPDEAYRYSLRSLRVYLTLNAVQESIDLLERLTELAVQTDRPDEAAQFREEAARIRRQLENEP